MSEQQPDEVAEETTEDVAGDAGVAVEDPPASEETGGENSVPEFNELDGRSAGVTPGKYDLNRFGGVQVVLTAELGRAKLTIQELMNLSGGAVIELDRAISAPVELVAQGVPLGNGEVVVIDDRFAIRIKEIYQA